MFDSEAYKYWSSRVSYDPITGLAFWLPRSVVNKHDKAFNTRFAGKRIGRFDQGYLNVRSDGRVYGVHRVAWVFITGDYPQGHMDHINGDRSDNRACNLREVSPLENGRNRKINSRNKSGVSGVFYNKRDRRWMAMIYSKRRPIYLGYFKSFDEAVLARKVAEAKIGFHPNHGASWRPYYSPHDQRGAA